MDDTTRTLESNRNFKQTVLNLSKEFIELRKDFVAECPDLSIDPQQTDRTTGRFESFTDELIKQYAEKQRPALAIYGANSSGKTAFIQHFLQIGEIMPSDVGAVTARIVKLTYSPENSASAHIFSSLEDRLTKKQPKTIVQLHEFFRNEELPDWEGVGNKLKEHLSRQDGLDENNFADWSKHFVEIGLPSPILRLGIDIYDTPGYLSNGRDEILNHNLYELLKSVQPTLFFLYENPAVSETDQNCFLSLKRALGSLETVPIFFLNTKADVFTILKNERVNTKGKVTRDKIEKAIGITRQRRYEFLLKHDVIKNDIIGGLPESIDECDRFDICTVPRPRTPFGEFAGLVNEGTFRRIILFAVRSDGATYQELVDRILSSIDEYFDLVRLSTYRTEAQWDLLRNEAMIWAERFFEKIKESLPTIINTIQDNILKLFDEQTEAIAGRAASLTRNDDRLGVKLPPSSNKVHDFVRIAVYEEVMKVAASEAMKTYLNDIDQISNDSLLNSKKRNELLTMAKRDLQFLEISGEELHRKKFFAAVLAHLSNVPTKIGEFITHLRTRPYLDWYNENTSEYQLLHALDASARLLNEAKRKEYALEYLVKMRQNITKQKSLFEQNIFEWIGTKQNQFIDRIKTGYQYVLSHMQQRKVANKLTEKYSERFAMLECQLIAAKDLAKFDGIKPTIFGEQLLGSGGFFNVYVAKWGDKENLAVKIQRPSTITDYPEAAYIEAHYHRAITNTRQTNVVPLLHMYYENNELCIFMPKYKRSLQSYLQEHIRTIKIDQILSFALIIANILNDIHQNDLVHRDIKSSNILLDDNDQCYLNDFGTVKVGTLNSTVIGTLPLPPEILATALFQQHNIPTVYDGKAVDIFAYGILLYELLPKKEYHRPDMDSAYEPENLFENDKVVPLFTEMKDYKQLVLDCLKQNFDQRPNTLQIISRIEELIRRNEFKDCAICLERKRTVRTLSCGHKVLCQQCRDELHSRSYDLCIVCKKLMCNDVHDDSQQTFYIKP